MHCRPCAARARRDSRATCFPLAGLAEHFEDCSVLVAGRSQNTGTCIELTYYTKRQVAAFFFFFFRSIYSCTFTCVYGNRRVHLYAVHAPYPSPLLFFTPPPLKKKMQVSNLVSGFLFEVNQTTFQRPAHSSGYLHGCLVRLKVFHPLNPHNLHVLWFFTSTETSGLLGTG